MDPWRYISTDDDGVSTIHVVEEDILTFSKFMHSVIKSKIGMQKGYFKVSRSGSNSFFVHITVRTSIL